MEHHIPSFNELNASLIFTLCFLFDKFVINKLNTSISKPYVYSLAIIRSCGMKSKALEKSVITPLKSAVCFSIFLSFFIFHLSTFLWRGRFGDTCLVYKISIHYLPMLPFDPPENTRKPKFQGNLGPILELNKKNSEKELQKFINSLPYLGSEEHFNF